MHLNCSNTRNNWPYSHFGPFSNKCTKSKKSHLKSDTITYLFSFNGKEKDNETYGEGNEYDYGFRIFNPRLGRFLSIDPLTNIYPELTPFQYASNTPIWAIDIDGLEAYPISRDWNADDLANFGNFITEETARIRKAEDNGNVNSYTVYDCSDLVISIYVRYAMANGLPITLTRYKDFSKYSSSDKEGIDQWDPADPEGSKLRFETYVREMTNTATLRIDMVSISADQAGPGDAQVTEKLLMWQNQKTKLMKFNRGR
jgi:RHS repeat-associated protein